MAASPFWPGRDAYLSQRGGKEEGCTLLNPPARKEQCRVGSAKEEPPPPPSPYPPAKGEPALPPQKPPPPPPQAEYMLKGFSADPYPPHMEELHKPCATGKEDQTRGQEAAAVE